PEYRKLGGRIVYAIEDLDAWAEIGRRSSTSDPGKGTIHPARPGRR
ncbi:DNA-binding protein, partial [Acinetobacter baumannii]